MTNLYKLYTSFTRNGPAFLAITTKEWLIQQGKNLLKRLGFNFLTKGQTETYLQPFQIATEPGSTLRLPSVANESKPGKLIFTEKVVTFPPTFVWHVSAPGGKARQLVTGSMMLNHNVLKTDYRHRDLLKTYIRPRIRRKVGTETLLAPWSQVFDDMWFGGYYDFMLLVAAKICRIRESLPESVFSEAIVAYPLLGTSYERDFMNLIGLRDNQVVDSRLYNVTFSDCVLGNSNSWIYPNVADIQSLKRQVEARVSTTPSERQRIYISRAGRRRIRNEAELIVALKSLGFQIIEDKPRSIAEQVRLYKSASFIIGPHGASFTNIIWCEPGTYLFELFSPTYTPDYFLYLAQVMNLRYTAYSHGEADDRFGISDDMYVAVPELVNRLRTLLDTPIQTN
ncbi:hypothetical protein BN8_02330 [Fibrisoma limi BUZ 3]|uniref:Glycosyltransferase 61 catalytic domain-containing protein n=1 Tax=Fibrisoma limi BUZ 3 TaxID=1185876 RepID=I2GH76_9BACT|nr:glycosyltransferase family 61 protein [Fibrisoma limi]CCH53251.1 hypothetical protein BN8_02330 [Fibrisoma limi BUZ 3]